jgi:hypothetical protein
MPDDKLSAKEAALLAQVRAAPGKNPEVHADTAAPPPGSPAAQRDTAQRAPGRSIAGAQGASPVARAGSAAPVARAERVAPVAAIQIVTLGGATRAPATDPVKRVAALMAAASAESERLQRRRHQLQVWVPVAFMCAAGLWALLWMWHRL